MAPILKNLGKKGSAVDLTFIISAIFSFAVVAIIVTLLVYHINSEFQDSDVLDTDAKAASETMSSGFASSMDGAVIFVFFGLCFLSLLLASLVAVHPTFLILYFLELIVLILVSGAISNAYQAVIENESISVIASYFSLSTSFFHYLPFVIAVIGIVLMVIMYKARATLWN